ncbi:hypothetical protein TL16_g03556 [Triparma laevis f. inornata]|uniref:Uncharacterized protein n=1 Tax=Triparma laevis f. inornata TaxID=1714386 RepID=A0A9W6ZZI0_9STRA|nr:hypothetical protein TL16_g03556 [Triparma laevis f. inornata]
MRILALTSYSSFGTILKISATCKALKPLARVVVEENEDPETKYLLALAMLGQCSNSASLALELRFHQNRAISLLLSLTKPHTNTSPLVQSKALNTLAEVHLTSISCSPSYTLESRLHGLSLLSTAYNCGAHSSNDTDLHTLSITSARKISEVYESGTYNIPQNFVLAAEWMLKSALLKDLESMCEYAVCAEMGYGAVEPNEAEAFRWYIKAGSETLRRVELGLDQEYHEETCAGLGEYYEKGKAGVQANLVKAVEWYRRGAEGGDEECERGLRRLRDIDVILGSTE